MRNERQPQRGIERVDRSVAMTLFVRFFTVDADLHHRGALVPVAAGIAAPQEVAFVFIQFEEWLVPSENPEDKQLKRSLRRLEFVALVLEAFDLLQDLGNLGGPFGKLETHRGGFDQHVGLSGKIGNGHNALIADERRVDMFVSSRQFLDGMHMQAPFVGECRAANEGSTDVMRHVGHLVDEARQIGQSRQVVDQRAGAFQLQQRDDGREVAVADALAVTVHRPLNLHGPRVDSRQSIGYTEPAVVMRVGTDRTTHRRRGRFGRFGHKRRKTSAIGVAKNNEIGTRLRSGFDRGQGILPVFAVTVEEVLRIIKHFPPVRLEESHRVADHGKVLFQGYPEDFYDMQRPCFAHDRDHGRPGVEQLADLRIVLHLHAAAPRHAESRDLCVFP